MLNYHQLTLVSVDTKIESITDPLSFYHNVSPTKELRDASNDAESLLLDYGVECSMRLDVFKAKIAAKENAEASGQWDKLSPEQKRLVDEMVDHFILLVQCNALLSQYDPQILDGTRAGLALPEEKRTELTTLNKEFSQVCLEFDVRPSLS
jgi:Zn-dependent oligopeptidase